MEKRPRVAGRRLVHGARIAVRRPAASSRVLPSFLIIGAQRGGTTSLFEYLCQHPGVCRPIEKELQFFTYRFGRGVDWYRSHFPTQAAAAGRLAFEATPYYLFHPEAPGRAASVLPEARLVALLRNPVDRAYSHHRHNVLRGTEKLSFEQALDAESERLQQSSRNGEDTSSQKRHSYVARGHYAEQLARWLEVYPREQLLVLFSEDLYRNTDETYGRVLRFLDLSPHRLPEYEVHTRGAGRSGPPLSTSTRARLEEVFAASNARLADLLGTAPPW
jgi:hypothetical protein